MSLDSVLGEKPLKCKVSCLYSPQKHVSASGARLFW